jgi:hypothetical protein
MHAGLASGAKVAVLVRRRPCFCTALVSNIEAALKKYDDQGR